MNIPIRLKLGMATRVRDFSQTHPYENAGYVAAVTQLGDRLGRAETLAQQEISGHRTVRGAIAARNALKREIADGLAMLTGVLKHAAREQPELAAGVKRPDRSSSLQSFLTRGRVAAATAGAHSAVLVRFGMAESYPAELSARLDQFEAALHERHAGQASHTGARADLAAVSAEIMGLVNRIGALNEFRFRNDAEALGAWRSARNVAWPVAERQKRPEAGGDLRPAA